MSGLGVRVAPGGALRHQRSVRPPARTPDGSPRLVLFPSFAHSSKEGARLQLETASFLEDTGRMLFPTYTQDSAGRAQPPSGQLPAS